ncbi:MAG TPA: NHL domain-containing thioredoxin family protein [Pseudonocardiaceae bacterium]|nr:NHL domain-containing thioredoxin family protein [Pseudonocardiaceae bacterium]
MTTATRRARVRAPELRGRGWLNTGGEQLRLADLRGKVLLLDFWTSCCINCLHVLDELRPLAEEFADVLVTIGVHSPKFAHEADPRVVADAVERYAVHHAVLDDPDLTTWQNYAVKAWPTLVLVDPEGYIVHVAAGEGHAEALRRVIREVIADHDDRGTLHRGTGPYVPPPAPDTTLRFPGKVTVTPGGTLLVSDTGAHRLVELAADADTVIREIGTGIRGTADGRPDAAQFAEPGGIALLPKEIAEAVGYDAVVADTVNHTLRALRLSDGFVTTIAGTGRPWRDGPTDGPAAKIDLTSPWDVAWWAPAGGVVVAMAGNHTLSVFDPVAGTVRRLAGTTVEGLNDGPAAEAFFAQPSALAATETHLWLADAETSALRYLTAAEPEPAGAEPEPAGAEPEPAGAPEPAAATGTGAAAATAPAASGTAHGSAARETVVATETGPAATFTVHTVAGTGLFDFGHRDGPAAEALFQHPLGIAALPDGSIAIADTYNGALRRYDPLTDQVSTLATDLAEPADVAVLDGEVIVVASAAHRLDRPVPPGVAGQLVAGPAHQVRRPPTELAPGAVTLAVVCQPPPGQKPDDRYGPSTRLEITASPPELIRSGAGETTDLSRALILADDVPSGVLHVVAQAASCDTEGEHPACRLTRQDWGVPIRITPAGATRLPLMLGGLDD